MVSWLRVADDHRRRLCVADGLRSKKNKTTARCCLHSALKPTDVGGRGVVEVPANRLSVYPTSTVLVAGNGTCRTGQYYC